MKIDEQAIYKKMIEWRRYLHQYPELSYKEVATSKWLQQTIIEFGNFDITKIGNTSFVATINGKLGTSDEVIAFRTDIDALPIEEETGLSFASTNKGVMHACGHDTHMAMVLGLAQVLSENVEAFSPIVKLVFQCAEEVPPGGALEIMQSGILNDVSYIYGIHIFPNHPVGHIGIASGAITASQDIIQLKVKGKGSHGATPELGVDPILVGSEIVSSIHHIVSRNISSFERAVVSFGQFHSGNIFNIIPDTAQLEGNVRTSNEDVRKKIRRRIQEVVAGITTAYGADYELDIKAGYSPVINDETATAYALKAAKASLGEKAIFTHPQKMVSEDFSEYTKGLKGCFMILGGGLEEDGYRYMNHHPKFIIDEQALLNGLKVYVQLVNEHSLQ